MGSPNDHDGSGKAEHMNRRIQSLLVANRSEIAIRIFRAATELGIRTVAVYAEEDKLSLHRFKADEAYEIGRGKGPIEAYLHIDEVLRVARAAKVDAVHPGYGFLSENPEFAAGCAEIGLSFIGPKPETLRLLGNKVDARDLAVSVAVPVMPATAALPDDHDEILRLADGIGYPLMLKASWGGGGRGMRAVDEPNKLAEMVRSAKRESMAAFGRDEVYLEKLVRRARHVEVQVLGDGWGNCVHLFERDCTIQRRNQKVIERAPAPYLEESTRRALCEAALRIVRATSYQGAGTVEFLIDADTGRFYFIEVNPRIQVEHTITEQVTGIDLVKAQIRIAEGGRIGVLDETGVPNQNEIALRGHAIQCRVTTENPENNFIADYGRISAYRGAFGPGIRIDNGTAYSGAVVTRYYDPLLEKIISWAPSPAEAIARMLRAVREYRVRGVATNLPFLEAVLGHPTFLSNEYTTRFIDETPALFGVNRRRDRATKLLTYIADVTINGHPEVRGRPRPNGCTYIAERSSLPSKPVKTGTRDLLASLGPVRFAKWVRSEKRVLITDTSMRDAHQSLLATRIRTNDIVSVASGYATGLPELFSLECWGGATFDVAMRFLHEDPWERLHLVRERAPNILTQMLVRGANAVGYTNYPDNVVTMFIREAARAGMDLFRVFDCFNWVENMRVSIDAIAGEGKLAQGAICYTGDILDRRRTKFQLNYYVDLAWQLEQAGCHMIAIKDMAGLLKPEAARVLVKALRESTDLPLHLHTHDTSGIAAATVLAAVEAGVDAVDAAMDSLSGTTSQPCLGSIVEMLRHTDRDSGLDPGIIRGLSDDWAAIRSQYAAFESDLKTGTSEIYLHEMPGGQFTNLREQARSLGLENRWHEVAEAYRAANDLLGDIVKVTPSSKVVGDLALMLVAQNITPNDVLNPQRDIAFPMSVVDMLRGELGQVPGGWPKALQRKVLKEDQPITVRPGALLGNVDVEERRRAASEGCSRELNDQELASWLMYPKVFEDYCATQVKYGPVASLPTMVFLYGMRAGEEIAVDLDPGKRLFIRLQALGDTEEDGQVKAFFELNGQPRVVRVPDRKAKALVPARRKGDGGNPNHVVAPMPGSIASVLVKPDDAVRAGDLLVVLEAMKMETAVYAPHDGLIVEVTCKPGDVADAKDLLIVLSKRQ